MKAIRILIALLFFLAPIAGRGVWFYHGMYQRSQPVPTPDFTSFKAPEPPVSVVLPASTNPDEPSGDTRAPVVLIDQYHANLYEPLEIAPLYQAIQEQGAQVVLYDGVLTLDEQLKRSNALVVIAPGATFLSSEVQAVKQFVGNGGRLLAITDPTRSEGYDYTTSMTVSTAHIANQLLAPYQISFVDDYAYNLVNNEGNFRNLLVNEFSDSPLTTGLSQVALYSAQSLRADTVLLTGGANTYSSLTDQGENLALAALGADGRVLAIGDLTFLTVPYVLVSDNQQFVRNIAAFLAGGENPPGLANFPIIFSRPVAVLVDGEEAISASQVQLISALQYGLQASLNLPVKIAKKPLEGYDLIVTATFDRLDEIKPFIKEDKLVFEADEEALPEMSDVFATPEPASGETDQPFPADEFDFSNLFDVESGEDSEVTGTLTIPEQGQFKTEGIGVVIFHAEAERNVLILLAGSQSSLGSLAGLLNEGSLVGCLQSDHIAVCPLD